MSDDTADTPRARIPATKPTTRRGTSRVLVLLFSSFAGCMCLLLCCGGLGYFLVGMVVQDVQKKLEADPTFAHHVGRVQEFKLNFSASVSAGDDAEVYDVKGTKWNGQVTLKQTEKFDADAKILWWRLRLPSGEIVEIKPDATPANGQ